MMFGLPLPLFAAGAVPPPLHWIDDQTVTGAANVEITWGDQNFEQVYILIDRLLPSAGNNGCYLRTSSDNGANFDSAASTYEHMLSLFTTGFYKESGRVSAFWFIPNGATWGNRTNGYGSFLVTLQRPYDTSETTQINVVGGYRSVNANATAIVEAGGFRDENGRVNGIQFTHGAANIGGRFQAWGLALYG